jgi:hypothetical protein
MVKYPSPTPISAGAVHLDGARLASQRRLRSATSRTRATMPAAGTILPIPMRAIAQPAAGIGFSNWRRCEYKRRLWIELGIICAAIVRHRKIYSQKFSRARNFLIARVMEFFQADLGTRKRRIAECFGSLGWTSVHPGEPRESEDRQAACVVRGRLPPAGGANRPAPVASRTGSPVR